MDVSQTSDTDSLSPLLNPEVILSAVEQARNANQSPLREQFRILREDIEQGRQSTRNPRHIFPTEVWVMITKNMRDLNDVVNCAQSNNLLLNTFSSPQEILLCKVLPHLVPYFGANPASMILKCGKVCPQWRSAVDRFADHYYRVDSPPRNGIEILTKDPVPKCLCNDIQKEDKLMFKDSPFLSALHILLDPVIRRDYLHTLEISGHCLWKLSLELSYRSALHTYRSSQIYAECVMAIGKCVNLKLFRLLHASGFQKLTDVEDNGVDGPLELQIPSTLEALEVVVKSPGILAVQDALLQKLCKQLKRLEVTNWNVESYHALQWTNLSELEILNEISLQVLDSLQQTLLPKLWKLHIHWNNNLNFVQLVNVVNQLDNLQHLSILLTEAVTEECLIVPIEILTINKVTTLEIFSQHLSEGLNIPVLFPLIRHLVYHHGPNAAKYKEFEGKDNTSATAKTFIRVYKHMYHSNVWTMLPKLETLTFNNETSESYGQQKFTRLGYVWATDNHAKGVQMHLTQIREKLKEIERRKLQTERERMQFELQDDDFEILPNSMCLLNKIDRSFRFIIPFLAQKDLLTSRLVCKRWKTLVGDSILENCRRNIPLIFFVPMSSHQQLQNFVSFVEDNARKTFFARTVEFKIKEEIECVEGLEMMLADLGKHIRDLTISTEIPLDLSNIYKVCVECMVQCPNLKSFSLRMPFVNNNTIAAYDQLKRCGLISKPVDLESLNFIGESFGNPKTGLFAFRRHLEETFADQLKTLVVPQLVINPNWELRELTVTNFETSSAFQSALYYGYHSEDEHNLRKLRLCITQQELCNRDLNDIVLYCNELEFLELQFTTGCFSFDKNLLYWDLFVSKSVTEFQIVFKNKFHICLDFLVHFSGIQTLRITYGKHAVLLNEQVGRSEMDTQISQPLLTGRSPQNDFIQLARYLKDENLPEHDASGIYESNIWSVLPRLKTLKLLYCSMEHIRETKVFCRKF